MNKKNGFILYDALVSFILLASMILVINKMVIINHNFEEQVTRDNEAVEFLRKSIYEKSTYRKNNNMYFSEKNDQYCVSYEREICVRK